MSFLQEIKQRSTPKVQKIVYLFFSAVIFLIGFLLLFVPFCLFEEDFLTGGLIKTEAQAFKPVSFLSMLNAENNPKNDILFLALTVFIFWIIYVIVLGISLVKEAIQFNDKEQKMQRHAKIIAIEGAVGTGIYFFGSMIFNIVNDSLGGKTKPASNVAPLLIVLVLDLLFAFYLGLLKDGSAVMEEGKTSLRDERVKTLKKYKVEFFIYASLLVVCALCTMLLNILTVQIVEKSSGTLSYEYSISGYELLFERSVADESSRVLAFLLFFAITCVLTAYVLSLVALLSKSNIFFRFTLATVVVSCIGCFVVAMYGKYYEMTQALHTDVLILWLEEKYQVSPSVIDLNTLKTQFTESYQITSGSFFFFLLAVLFIGIVVLRRPYSNGLTLARELEPVSTNLTAKIAKAEIDVENANGESGRVPAPLVGEASGAFAGGEVCVDPCPAFTELDDMASEFLAETERKKTETLFEEPTLPKLVQYIVQYARDSRLHLFYTVEDIATFIAGLGTTKLSILQGMSGTGKTSLPKIFSEAIFSNCEIVEVESSWRDKNELLGYYNEFSKTYTPKKFTQALYKATLNPDTLTFIVLDEMNLSRIEYYFSDFLSLMENEPDKRAIKLLNVKLARMRGGEKIEYKGLTRGHTIKILPNVWFIGTANRDESTFEISDKVYDRAHTMNFNQRAKKVHCYNEPLSPRFLPVSVFNSLLDEAKKSIDFTIENYPLIGEVEKLLAPYNISFGNRIAMQIESFVSIYCACFTATDEVIHDAVERILLSKVVSKLELKSVENKEELAAAFSSLGLFRCSEFIEKLNED